MKKRIILLLCLVPVCLYGFRGTHHPRGVIVVNTGWGGGVGKMVEYFGKWADIIVRSVTGYTFPSAGGNEKGHRIVRKDRVADEEHEFYFTLLPSGIVRKNTVCCLTAGMEIYLPLLLEEMGTLKVRNIKVDGRLWISAKAQVVMPYHIKLDEMMTKRYSNSVDVGSLKGTGSAAADKRLRLGIRVADLLDKKRFKQVLKEGVEYANEKLTKLFNEKPFDYDKIYAEYSNYAEQIRPFVRDDVELKINRKLLEGKMVIFEGSQGTFSDVALGSAPYVSSTGTIAANLIAGAGVSPRGIGYIIGIVPAYTTRNGAGPLPSEIKDPKIINTIKNTHAETSSGDIPGQRYGWLDIVLTREAILYNGIDSIVISKLDELDDLDEIKICYDYVVDGKNYDYLPPVVSDSKKIEPRYITMQGWKKSTRDAKTFSQLPENAKAFVNKVKVLCGVEVTHVSTGPASHQTISLTNDLPF